jgi:hypothetical protein
MKQNQAKSLSLKLPSALDAKLRAVAKRRGTKLSSIVREALEVYLNDKKQLAGLAFYDSAKDLIGCVDGGPGDLADNPKHMERYGK